METKCVVSAVLSALRLCLPPVQLYSLSSVAAVGFLEVF